MCCAVVALTLPGQWLVLVSAHPALFDISNMNGELANLHLNRLGLGGGSWPICMSEGWASMVVFEFVISCTDLGF